MEDRWLSVDEISGYLGVSKDTIYTWVTTKGMPGHKVGRFWKFKPGDVDKWIRTGGCNCPYEDPLRSMARDGRGHMKLYYDPITVNSRKVVAGLDLLGVPYEEVKVDYFAQEQKKPDFLAINPNGELPALVDGDMKLWESNAILVYGADKSGPTSAYPQDPKIRADIHRWLLWESSKWFPGCYVSWLKTSSNRCSSPSRISRCSTRTRPRSIVWRRSSRRDLTVGPGLPGRTLPWPTSPSRRRCTCIATKSCRSSLSRICAAGWSKSRPSPVGNARIRYRCSGWRRPELLSTMGRGAGEGRRRRGARACVRPRRSLPRPEV